MPATILFQDSAYQLANGIREAMLQQGYGKALLLIEALYQLKFRADIWLTYDQILRILQINYAISQKQVYYGLKQGLVFQHRKAARRPHQRGATPHEYRIPFPTELEAEFAPGQANTPTDLIQKSDLKNLTTYRLALHREMHIRKYCKEGKGFDMSRALQADRLGVSKRTIRTYEKRLGFSNVPNFNEQVIDQSNWNSLPRYRIKYTPDGKAIASKQWLRIVDGETGIARSYPLVRFLAYKGLKEGHLVYKVERLANTYYPYQRPKEADFDPSDPVAYYVADMAARRAAGLYEDSDGNWYYRRE